MFILPFLCSFGLPARLACGAWLVLVCFNACADDLIVYGGESFQPEIYLKNGQPAGIIPALLKRIGRDTGDNYQLVLLPWKRAVHEATEGNGGISAFSWTADRAKVFDFTEPILDKPIRLVVLKDRARQFRDINDLKGQTIGLPYGSTFGDAFNRKINDKVILVDEDNNPVSRIKKLLLHRIDLAAISDGGLAPVLKSDPELASKGDLLTLLPFNLASDMMYLAFPKAMHRELAVQRFNKALLALKKSAEYQKIIEQNSSD